MKKEKLNIKMNNNLLIFLAIAIIFSFSFLISGFFGSADIGAQDVLKVIANRLFNIKTEAIDKGIIYIVWELRIPRALLAIAVGGGLAISGVSMQAVTQNILAEPYMLGVSSGALVGVTIVNYFNLSVGHSSIVTPIIAFLGALFALVFVYKVGGVGIAASSNRLILAGLAISIILNAVANFMLITMPDPNAIRNVISWTMGSLSRARWNNITIPIVGILIASIYFMMNVRHYDTISLGSDTALSLGVDVVKLKRRSIIIVAIISAFAVSSAGIIGLIGFIIPHINRLIFGTEHRKLYPLSFILGALFLLWMDILARTLLAPQELPIGIFTAIVGGPFFVWMLLKKRK